MPPYRPVGAPHLQSALVTYCCALILMNVNRSPKTESWGLLEPASNTSRNGLQMWPPTTSIHFRRALGQVQGTAKWNRSSWWPQDYSTLNPWLLPLLEWLLISRSLNRHGVLGSLFPNFMLYALLSPWIGAQVPTLVTCVLLVVDHFQSLVRAEKHPNSFAVHCEADMQSHAKI